MCLDLRAYLEYYKPSLTHMAVPLVMMSTNTVIQ